MLSPCFFLISHPCISSPQIIPVPYTHIPSPCLILICVPLPLPFPSPPSATRRRSCGSGSLGTTTCSWTSMKWCGYCNSVPPHVIAGPSVVSQVAWVSAHRYCRAPPTLDVRLFNRLCGMPPFLPCLPATHLSCRCPRAKAATSSSKCVSVTTALCSAVPTLGLCSWKHVWLAGWLAGWLASTMQSSCVACFPTGWMNPCGPQLYHVP